MVADSNVNGPLRTFAFWLGLIGIIVVFIMPLSTKLFSNYPDVDLSFRSAWTALSHFTGLEKRNLIIIFSSALCLSLIVSFISSKRMKSAPMVKGSFRSPFVPKLKPFPNLRIKGNIVGRYKFDIARRSGAGEHRVNYTVVYTLRFDQIYQFPIYIAYMLNEKSDQELHKILQDAQKSDLAIEFELNEELEPKILTER